MSTNYYLVSSKTIDLSPTETVIEETTLHLGKTYSAGEGHVHFIWAASPLQLFRALANSDEDRSNPDITDEVGRSFSFSDFLAILQHCQGHEYDSIGVNFT